MIHVAALIVLALLLILDGLQTVTIAREPLLWRERNPVIRGFMRLAEKFHFLPEHGVVLYFTLASLVIFGLAVILHKHPAFWLWVGGMAGLELLCVINNHRLGIRPARF